MTTTATPTRRTRRPVHEVLTPDDRTYKPEMLTMLVDQYESAQKLRKAQFNRMRSWLRDTLPREQWGNVDFSDDRLSDDKVLPFLRNDQRAVIDQIHTLEQWAAKGMTLLIAQHPLWPWLEQQRGIGPVLSARLLARIDPARFTKGLEGLYSYCGLDGPEWRRKNEAGQLTYSPKLHTLTWQIAASFEKQSVGSGGYRDMYDYRKAYEATKPSCNRSVFMKGDCRNKPTCSDGHIRLRALRWVAKRFLADMWAEWERLQVEPAT